MWAQLIGEKSTAVGKPGRVDHLEGANLRRKPLPSDAALAVVPFNSLVQVQRITEHGWAWVVVLDGSAGGKSGFVAADRVATDLPEPTARLHWVTSGERLGAIAQQYYGDALGKEDNERLFVQALYEANRGRAGIQLDKVELPTKDTWHRTESAEESLRIFKGVKVKKDHALWIPSLAFVQALKSAGDISAGRPIGAGAWDEAKEVVGGALEGATYSAGILVGILEGAWKAVVDLFKGAWEMIETVGKTVFYALTGDLGAIKKMATDLIDKLKAAWSNRGAIADAFLSKWNDPDAWTRGNFQGEVLGWVLMTVLLVILTMGEGAIATALGSSAWGARFLKAIRTADALGDVTTYARGLSKIIKLPPKGPHLPEERISTEGKQLEPPDGELGRSSASATEVVSETVYAFRRAKKIHSVGAISLKRLRLVLGRAGARPGNYSLVMATKAQLDELGDAAANVYGWVARDGAGNVAKDLRGRPVITFTPKGLSSLEDAVKTFGHEVKHLKDFAAGLTTSSEALAEEAGEKLWMIVDQSLTSMSK